MKRYVASLLAAVAILPGCSRTVRVSVPPRMELKSYGTLVIVQFTSNSDGAIDVLATRQFQEQVQAAQPGTRFIELGSRPALLGAVGAAPLDAEAARKIGAWVGVAAIFLGQIVYAAPTADGKVTALARLDGDAARKIGAKFGVAAIFLGEIVYAEPTADVKVTDLARLDGAVRAEVRGDISARLIEAASGASVWSSSAWARRQIGGVRVS